MRGGALCLGMKCTYEVNIVWVAAVVLAVLIHMWRDRMPGRPGVSRLLKPPRFGHAGNQIHSLRRGVLSASWPPINVGAGNR